MGRTTPPGRRESTTPRPPAATSSPTKTTWGRSPASSSTGSATRTSSTGLSPPNEPPWPPEADHWPTTISAKFSASLYPNQIGSRWRSRRVGRRRRRPGGGQLRRPVGRAPGSHVTRIEQQSVPPACLGTDATVQAL